jgi:hypothetical protein
VKSEAKIEEEESSETTSSTLTKSKSKHRKKKSKKKSRKNSCYYCENVSNFRCFILLTGSNNQFQNYESSISGIF